MLSEHQLERGFIMFKQGDRIMYNDLGVCEITDITTVEWNQDDAGRLYYVLRPLYKDDMIYAPVDNDKIYMRPIMTKKEIHELIDMMPDVDAGNYEARSIQQLSREYRSAINTHESIDLIRLTKSIHMKMEKAIKNNKHVGQIDMRFMRHAEDILFGEIAAVLNIPRDDVESYIEDRIGSSDEVH